MTVLFPFCFFICSLLRMTATLFIEKNITLFTSYAQNVSGAFHMKSNKTFYLFPQVGIIFDDDNPTNNNIKIPISFINIDIPYAIPIDNDNIILICTDNFLQVSDSEGNKIKNVSYSEISNFSIDDAKKCKGVLSPQNILTVYTINSIHDTLFLSFFSFSFNQTDFSFTSLNSITINSETDYMQNYECVYFDNQINLFCVYLFQNETIQGIMYIPELPKIENILNLTQVSGNFLSIRMIKIEPNKAIVSALSFYNTTFYEVESDGQMVNEKKRKLVDCTDFDNYFSMAPLDETNFVYAFNNNHEIVFHFASVDFFEQEPKTFKVIGKNNNPFFGIFIVSYSPFLFNSLITNKGNSDTANSLLIRLYECYNLKYIIHIINKINISFSQLSPEDESLCEIEVVGYNHNAGSVIISPQNILEYSPIIGESNLIGYRIIEKNNDENFSIICSIDITICNEACSTCNNYSSNSQDTKCTSCLDGYTNLVDDASNCRNKAVPIEFYYLDNRANLFKKCYKTCKYCFGEGTDIFHNCSQCIDGYVQTPDTKNCLAQEYVEQMKENIKEAYKNSTLINENGMTIQIYNTSKEGIEEASDAFGNISSIDFRECENILKQHYNISESSPLIILKVDIFREDQIVNQVEYMIFDIYGKALDLSLCNNTKIIISSPIKDVSEINISLAQDLAYYGYDLYNSSDAFYTDVCTPYTTEDNTDIPLEDRKKDYYQNISFCEEGCEYDGINLTEKTVNCSCTPKAIISGEPSKFSFNSLGEKFKSVLSESNIKVFKCFDLVFDSENLFKNIGSWVIMGEIFAEISLVIIYAITGIKPLAKLLDSLFEIAASNSVLSPSTTIIKKTDSQRLYKDPPQDIIVIHPSGNPPSKSKGNLKKKKNERFNEVKFNFERNKNFDFTMDKNNNMGSSNRILKNSAHTLVIEKNLQTSCYIGDNDIPEISIQSLPQKSKSGKIDSFIMRNQSYVFSEDKSKKTNETLREGDTISKYSNESSSKQGIIEHNDKNIDIKTYTNEELNDMSFNEALLYDNRTFCKYYCSILYYSQLILFTFFLKTDYNLKVLKISMFVFGFAMYIAFNTLFYTDSTMSYNYRNKGVIDLIYSLPKTIYSSLMCALITFLLNLLSLSQSNIKVIKEEKDQMVAREKTKKFMKCLKIKIWIFYIILFGLSFLFWYYIAAFCVVYKNTQKHLFLDTLVSFCFSMFTPFLFCLITASFRIWGLSAKSKCLYGTNKLLQVIL